MQMMIEPQEEITIAVNTQTGMDRLRELVNELEDGTILSLDFSEVIADGKEEE